MIPCHMNYSLTNTSWTTVNKKDFKQALKLLHKKSNLFFDHYKNLNKRWFIKFTDILYSLKKNI